MNDLLSQLVCTLIHEVGTSDFIDEADCFTHGIVSSYVQEAVDNAIIDALTDYINNNNISFKDLPENWRYCLIDLLK